jgi:hypothetical protein
MGSARSFRARQLSDQVVQKVFIFWAVSTFKTKQQLVAINTVSRSVPSSTRNNGLQINNQKPGGEMM